MVSIEGPATGSVTLPGASRDEGTRYLCAAAHLSRDFADAAIGELLTEPTRQAAPEAGVDAVAVLTESLAARLRTDVVDVLVLLMLVPAVVFALPLVVAWSLVALLLSLPKLIRAWRAARTGSARGVRPVRVFFAVALLLGPVLRLGVEGDSDDVFEAALTDWVSLVVLGAFFVVLLLNRLVIARHVVGRFGPRSHVGAAVPPPDRFLFKLAPALFDRVLSHARTRRPGPDVADGDELVRLVVHRGYKPFVGAGDITEPWTVAIPLERAGAPSDEDLALDAATLLRGITDKVADLTRTGSLAPSRRLRELTVEDVVLVSARGLVNHLHDPVTRPYLRSNEDRPYTHVSRRHAEELRDRPLEWARFYRRFSVETWDRDLVLSVFVHVAMDDSTLYLEWTPCVLKPVNTELRAVDAQPASPGAPFRQAAKDLVLLPAGVVTRLVRLARRPRSLPEDRGVVNPDRYGALTSLREMAADTEVESYFQQADVERYGHLLRTRVTLAVSELLRAANYRTSSFDTQVGSIVNNTVNAVTVTDGGTITGHVLQAGKLDGGVDITG
ncbi:hypothetical protein ACFV4N_09585 [Actinosynnema sp. NPDC059797]